MLCKILIILMKGFATYATCIYIISLGNAGRIYGFNEDVVVLAGGSAILTYTVLIHFVSERLGEVGSY